MLPKPQRIKFTKTGKLKYISHLDLCRSFRSVLARAKVPIYYSEGFNPHPKMVFALPLSIGTESICEYLDIKIVEDVSCEELKANISAALPPDITIEEVYEPQSKFTEIKWAEYDITNKDEFSVEPLSAEKIEIAKKSKSGVKNTDIKPLIRCYELNGNVLTIQLSADNSDYLNPEYIAQILELDEYSIVRKHILRADGIEFR